MNGYKLPKDIKKRWVEALRSGDYTQGWGRLKINGGYCCLGVLQQILDGKVEMYDDPSIGFAEVPSEKWCEDHDIRYNFWNICTELNLATENDKGASFQEIANIIEEHL